MSEEMTKLIAEGEEWTNANGEHDCTCGCETWINHWNNYVKAKSDECRVAGCTQKGVFGGHMHNGSSRELYIIPLCQKHNNQFGETFEMKAVRAVRAIEGNNCGS